MNNLIWMIFISTPVPFTILASTSILRCVDFMLTYDMYAEKKIEKSWYEKIKN